jgi:hypothetical protein
VIHCLAPSMIQLSPSRTAVVRIPFGSLPASVSLKAKEPAAHSPLASFGLQRAFCSGVPKVAITSPTMLVTAIVTPVEAHAAEISCMASA